MNVLTRQRCKKCRWVMLKNKGWVGEPLFCFNVFCDKFWENIYQNQITKLTDSEGEN